jgi:hypothetical protein
LAILMLLLLAMIGPWTFDLIVVPSEYACSAPFVRLKGDYCGTPLSGMWILSAVVGEFISLVVRLVTGAATLADLGRMPLISLLVLLPLLPLVSTLLLILLGDRPGRQTFHLAAWGLAVASTSGVLVFAPELPASQLWGLWLYVGLAPGVLILEVVTLALSKRSNQAR